MSPTGGYRPISPDAPAVPGSRARGYLEAAAGEPGGEPVLGEDLRPEDLDRFEEELYGSARVPLSLVERLDDLLLSLEETVGLLCTVVTCRCEGDLGGLRAALSELEGTLDHDLGSILEEALASVRHISDTVADSEGPEG